MINTKNIPNEPGCYLYKDSTGRIIYIGKAKNLKRRVSSYFNKKLDPKTSNLVEHISSVDFIATNNEVEALLLENNLINQHQPKYNIDLRESRRYAYLCITKDAFPRIFVARQLSNEGEYFGPFASAYGRDEVLQTLCKVFMIRTCVKMPKKPCLRYYIKLCAAPCIGRITLGDYGNSVEKARTVLKGSVDALSKQLETEMKEYSEKKNYEKALKLRDDINALKKLKEGQVVERRKNYNEDIIMHLTKNNTVYLLVFNVENGVLKNKKEFTFEYCDGFFEEFVVQYYSANAVPKELVTSEKLDAPVKEFLELKRKSKVSIISPKSGEKKKLLELARKNIEISFFGDVKKLEALKDALKLQELPEVVECFDISHISGTSTAGSMVQFRNGKPDKNNYRRFRIKTVLGVDDYASLSEVIRRRYTRLLAERSVMPNLVIVDGGKGQLGAALSELNNLGLKIPVVSIAKEFEEVFVPGQPKPVEMDKKGDALQFIRAMRDEAHRFAISYNRLLRKKKVFGE